MIEPVSDALTTSISPAWRAKNAMISSAMLPNVAFRMPPTCGPVIAPSRSRREPDDPGQAEDRHRRDDEERASRSAWRTKSRTIVDDGSGRP